MFESFFSISKAPEFPQNFDWINSDEPLTLSKLKGNVVVVDFWTYCCINCMHTLPVLSELEEMYRGRPVVFVGVHSGKFFSEQEAKNVESAVARYEIEHPLGLCVTQDNVFVADTYNSAIQVINLKNNQVYTIIGKTENNVCLPDSPTCDILSLYEPADVEIFDGKLYIADTNNHLIRVFDLKTNALNTLDVR